MAVANINKHASVSIETVLKEEELRAFRRALDRASNLRVGDIIWYDPVDAPAQGMLNATTFDITAQDGETARMVQSDCVSYRFRVNGGQVIEMTMSRLTYRPSADHQPIGVVSAAEHWDRTNQVSFEDMTADQFSETLLKKAFQVKMRYEKIVERNGQRRKEQVRYAFSLVERPKK